MDVSENRGNGWFIFMMENPYFLMDDFGGTPIFRKHPNVFGNVKKIVLILYLLKKHAVFFCDM